MVTTAPPLRPSLVAVTVIVPSATPVTAPLGATNAMAVLDELQSTVRPVSTLPLASRNVAAKVWDSPMGICALVGAMVTEATGTLATVKVAAPLRPSVAAVIVVAPDASAVIRPSLAMEAMLEFDDVHVTVRSPS
jgi:hypothetical protein